MVGVGDVADGEDVRVAAAQSRRRPARRCRRPGPACSASSVFGAAPTPTTTASAGTTRPVGERARRTRRPSLVAISVTRHAGRRSTPWSRCRSANTRASSAPEHAQQRQLAVASTTVTSRAGVAGRGRDLQADPAAADDGQPAIGAERVAESRSRVLDAAQVVHAVGVGARHRQPARRRAGGEQQLVVADPSRRRPGSPRARRGRCAVTVVASRRSTSWSSYHSAGGPCAQSSVDLPCR